ncbi:MAG: cation transporter [Muribaculaceae bacterium]|nr:cation transporter [Muribaculaceae bacterium]MDE7141865.1 cation transporter [Muribaculaceae bacterium]
MKRIATLFAAVGLMAAAFAPSAGAKDDAKQESTVVFTVSPKMSCANCENKIKQNLRFEKGVSSVATDLKAQTVTVKYNPGKTDAANIGKAFGKIGYTATAADGGCSSAKGGADCSKSDAGKCAGGAERHCGGCASGK